MKLFVCAAALVTLTATPLLAQTAPAAPAAAVAPATPVAPAAPVAATPAAGATMAGKFSLDTPIETIVADATGKAAIDANMPGMTAHPAFDQFKSMSLKQLQPLAQGQITDEQLTKVAVALAAIM